MVVVPAHITDILLMHCHQQRLLTLCESITCSSPSQVASADCTAPLLHSFCLQPDEHGQVQKFLHRDIKLDNVTYDKEHNFFVLIDYGAFISVDQTPFRDAAWFDAIDKRCVIWS